MLAMVRLFEMVVDLFPMLHSPLLPLLAVELHENDRLASAEFVVGIAVPY